MEPQDFVQRSGQKMSRVRLAALGRASPLASEKIRSTRLPHSPSLEGQWRWTLPSNLYHSSHLSFMFSFNKFHSLLWSQLASPGGLQVHSIRKRTVEEGKRILAKSQNVDNNIPIAMEHSRISWGCCENQLMFVKAFEFLRGKVPPER